jgi:hypothetical protein
MSTLVYTRFEVGRLRLPLDTLIASTAPYLTPEFLISLTTSH